MLGIPNKPRFSGWPRTWLHSSFLGPSRLSREVEWRHYSASFYSNLSKEKLFVAARLPSSAQDKEHQKKVQTRLNSKIPEVCLTTKGIAFWGGKWGPGGPVLCNDLWLLEVRSALHPAQPSSWESLGTFSVSSCRGFPRPDGNPEHCAEFCRQTLQAAQWTKSVVRRHLTMTALCWSPCVCTLGWRAWGSVKLCHP